MKNSRKLTIFAGLAGPVMFSSCVAGLREAVIEGGFAFVEESAVEVLQTALPLHLLLEGAEGAEAVAEEEH